MKKMIKYKRFLGIFLLAIMLIGMLPSVNSFASELTRQEKANQRIQLVKERIKENDVLRKVVLEPTPKDNPRYIPLPRPMLVKNKNKINND